MTTARLVVTVAMLMAAMGCTSDGEEVGEAAPSCAGVVTFADRSYLPTDEAGFTVGEKLGTATIEGCDDTPGDRDVAVPQATTGAYAVDGVDPAEAVAVGDSPGEAVLMGVLR